MSDHRGRLFGTPGLGSGCLRELHRPMAAQVLDVVGEEVTCVALHLQGCVIMFNWHLLGNLAKAVLGSGGLGEL